jgi:hypothetical protein
MRKGGRYKSGHDPVEGSRQLTISFEQGYQFTVIHDEYSVSSTNYSFLVHPEMKKELDKWWADGMIEAGGNTDAKISDTDIGSMLDDAITGTDEYPD